MAATGRHLTTRAPRPSEDGDLLTRTGPLTICLDSFGLREYFRGVGFSVLLVAMPE
jgi:hypothetical protein